ncbi:MAG: ester cyclase [Candidatus Rokubacteria bacterium]|nr:ester cyclase [Candidatus Rokubacteria bacterium]
MCRSAATRSSAASRGTHRGTFWGIAPSGGRVELPEIAIYRVAGGKVVEPWCAFDELTWMQQFGATLARP